ncbi:hypothetical protein TWF481_004949 [Arthrobotrys musiformis]|uniref:F-box domain-containing protein n=1 Tax=Arthrobotrys musiformis TaxID=47236 RepID=A0AAV9WL96_9PEZI
MPKSKPTITTLPTELQYQILSHLHPWHLPPLQTVCKLWKSLIESSTTQHTTLLSPQIPSHWLLSHNSTIRNCTHPQDGDHLILVRRFTKNPQVSPNAAIIIQPPDKIWLCTCITGSKSAYTSYTLPAGILSQPAFITTKTLTINYKIYSIYSHRYFVTTLVIPSTRGGVSIGEFMERFWGKMVEETEVATSGLEVMYRIRFSANVEGGGVVVSVGLWSDYESLRMALGLPR